MVNNLKELMDIRNKIILDTLKEIYENGVKNDNKTSDININNENLKKLEEMEINEMILFQYRNILLVLKGYQKLLFDSNLDLNDICITKSVNNLLMMLINIETYSETIIRTIINLKKEISKLDEIKREAIIDTIKNFRELIRHIRLLFASINANLMNNTEVKKITSIDSIMNNTEVKKITSIDSIMNENLTFYDSIVGNFLYVINNGHSHMYEIKKVQIRESEILVVLNRYENNTEIIINIFDIFAVHTSNTFIYSYGIKNVFQLESGNGE